MRVIVIVGPTATGKTRLGVEVAHRLGSEIISADSRQVYRGLDIGTGKDLAEYSQVVPPVPYHLIDLVEPDEVYSLFRFQQDCYRVFESFAEREGFADGTIPLLLVGGTGLYVEAVIGRYRLADVPPDPELRKKLERIPTEDLREQAEQRSTGAGPIDLSTRRRMIRTIEISQAERRGPVPYSGEPGADVSYTVFGIASDRATLRMRIRDRLLLRLDDGLIDEVRNLIERGLTPERLNDLGLEYREVAAYLLGHKSRDQMASDLERAIGRFAKRQQTWFEGMERRGIPVEWIGSNDADLILERIGSRCNVHRPPS